MAIKFKHKFNIEKFVRFRVEPIYNSKWTTKMITKLMKSGKRSIIERKIYEVFHIIRKKFLKKNIAQYLTQYLYETKPLMDLRLRRQWNRLVPVPFPLKLRRQLIKAMSNLVYKIRENPQEGKRKKSKIKSRILSILLNMQKKKESQLAKKRDIYNNKVVFAGRYLRYRWK